MESNNPARKQDSIDPINANDSRCIAPPSRLLAPEPRLSLIPQTVSGSEDPPNNPQENSDKKPNEHD